MMLSQEWRVDLGKRFDVSYVSVWGLGNVNVCHTCDFPWIVTITMLLPPQYPVAWSQGIQMWIGDSVDPRLNTNCTLILYSTLPADGSRQASDFGLKYIKQCVILSPIIAGAGNIPLFGTGPLRDRTQVCF
jgi:hypothetical protein